METLTSLELLIAASVLLGAAALCVIAHKLSESDDPFTDERLKDIYLRGYDDARCDLVAHGRHFETEKVMRDRYPVSINKHYKKFLKD